VREVKVADSLGVVPPGRAEVAAEVRELRAAASEDDQQPGVGEAGRTVDEQALPSPDGMEAVEVAARVAGLHRSHSASSAHVTSPR